VKANRRHFRWLGWRAPFKMLMEIGTVENIPKFIARACNKPPVKSWANEPYA
jgi:hypothetical protein